MWQLIYLTQALVWPIVVVVAVILLHRPLGRALEGMSSRVTKFSVSMVSVELQPLTPVELPWHIAAGSETLDARSLTSAMVFDSWASTLFEQLSIEGGAEVAMIDLGRGDRWLTSRLFLFAVLLERNRGVRCLAFTYDRPDYPRAFFGVAAPRNVRFALAQASPWLEAAWAHAYNGYFEQAGGTASVGPRGELKVDRAIAVARSFLEKIQNASPPKSEEAQWLTLPSSTQTPTPMSEHTTWVRPDQLDRHLDSAIDRNSHVSDDPTTPTKERTRLLMLQRGPFVALVDDGGRLSGVVERLPVIEAATRRQLEAENPTKKN